MEFYRTPGRSRKSTKQSPQWNATDVTEQIRVLDNRLDKLEMAMLQSCDIRRVSIIDDHPHVFDNHYDVYPDHFRTQTWNAIRMMRLELNSLLQNFTAGHSSHLEAQASEAISRLTRQICASAPQFFLPGARLEHETPLSLLQKLQCGTLLTPLFLACQLSADHRMQDWIQRIMLHIAEAGDMMIARDVVRVLREEPGTDYWAVYAMTGCYALAA